MNGKRTFATGIVVASMATLAACGADVEHGTIINMSYTPGHTSVYLRTIYGQRCSSSMSKIGKVYVSRRSCTSYVSGHVPIVTHSSSTYELELKDAKGHTGWVYVTEAQYNSVHEGGHW